LKHSVSFPPPHNPAVPRSCSVRVALGADGAQRRGHLARPGTQGGVPHCPGALPRLFVATEKFL
jgi:hypothetical protein